MSTISELHNPVLNIGLLERIYANGVKQDRAEDQA